MYLIVYVFIAFVVFVFSNLNIKKQRLH